jgi:hypothetical protein
MGLGIIPCHKFFSLERLSLWKEMKGMTSPETLIWAGMKCGNVMKVEEHAGRKNFTSEWLKTCF